MNIDRLLEYEKKGFLFHGSPSSTITVIEPRKARNSDDTEFNNDDAIFASKYACAAALFACMDLTNLPDGAWEIGNHREDKQIVAQLPKMWRNKLQENHGYVYVINNTGFVSTPGWQSKTHEAVTPIESIAVSFSDFELLGGRIIWI
jgi:hypothetical protein